MELTCRPSTCGPSTMPASSSTTTTGSAIPARLANEPTVPAIAAAAMIARKVSGEIVLLTACIT
jgi:hypothetical protein